VILIGCDINNSGGSKNARPGETGFGSSTEGASDATVRYNRLPLAAPIAFHPGKVEVVEFFSYECPNCYTLEPHLVLWNGYKPDYVEFQRIPSAQRPITVAHAKLYYILEALNRLDVHADVFDAIHRRRISLYSDNPNETFEQQLQFARLHGISEDDFRRAYNSPIVASNIKRAQQLALRFRVATVPTMIINGKYSTDPDIAKGESNLMTLLMDLPRSEHNVSR
jgi:thiol:disulfide interchange protein DsbA